MSTSYYVYCKTCSIAVTDQNECDNQPEIPRCIVDNIISYAHLAMFLEELPTPNSCFYEYSIQLSGNRIDLSGLRKHCTHLLCVMTEYGTELLKDGTELNLDGSIYYKDGKYYAPLNT